MTNLECVKKQRHYFANKGPYSQGYCLSGSHVQIWELDHQEGRVLSNCGAGEDSWASLNIKEVKPVNPKGNQSWILIGSTDAEADAPILWPSDAKSWFIRKDPDAKKNWRQKKKRASRKRWLDGITDWKDINFSKLQKMVRDREAWRATGHGVTKSGTQLSD